MSAEIVARFVELVRQEPSAEQVCAIKDLVRETKYPFWEIDEVAAWVKENKTLIVETLDPECK